jgi:hypothetical protein
VKRITYLSVANAEVAEAVAYYDHQRNGLGDEFLDEFENVIAAVRGEPEHFAFFKKPVRSARVSRFPYRILFRDFPDRVQVVAVAHLSRRPGYWMDRFDKE